MNKLISSDTARIRENDRRKQYTALVAAIRDRDEKAEKRLVPGINLFASSATDYGWRLSDVQTVYNRLDSRLNSDRETLAYKRQEFNTPNNRTCRRDASSLKYLQVTIDHLTDDVRIINRLHSIFGDALRRRGQLVGIVTIDHVESYAHA
jgi:hypothetical protein